QRSHNDSANIGLNGTIWCGAAGGSQAGAPQQEGRKREEEGRKARTFGSDKSPIDTMGTRPSAGFDVNTRSNSPPAAPLSPPPPRPPLPSASAAATGAGPDAECAHGVWSANRSSLLRTASLLGAA